MKNLWASLVNIGIIDRTNARQSKHIAFLNTIVLLVLLLIIQNLLLTAFYYPGTLPLIPVFAGHFLFIALTLVWNRGGHYLLGRVWFGLSATLFLTLYSITMGPASYWELFLAVCVFLQFYTFPESERPWMIFVVLVCSLCFLGVHFLVPPHGILSDLPPGFVRAETIFNLVGFLFCAVCMGAVGYVVVNRSEGKLVVERERSEQALVELKATQARLIQQEKMASLGKLTAGIAHEIKNPLNFVNNFAALSRELVDELKEVLRADDPDEADVILADITSNAEKIEEHGRRADSIVRAMMQHAHGGSGQREPVDFNAFVDEHVDLAYHGKRAQVPELKVEIKRELGTDVGKAELVRQEIGQVLLNLIGNAFDAVHERAARVGSDYAPCMTVSTRQVDGQVEIRVSDNGPGIPAEIRDRIFEPFFTTKPAGSGTGLGLSLSYDIVTQGHRGMLTVESEEGQGATFIVTLPLNHKEPASRA